MRDETKTKAQLIDELGQLRRRLAEKETGYRTLFTESLNAFALHEILCDSEGRPCDYRFLEVNPAFERQTGLKAAHVLGRTIREIMPNPDPFWIEQYGRVALTGQASHFERYSPELNRHYQVTAYCPERGRFAVLFSDITAVKQTAEELRASNERLQRTVEELQVAEEELRQQNDELFRAREALKAEHQRYQSMFENNHAVMLLIDPETGLIVDANSAACAFYGHGKSRMLKLKITDLNVLPEVQVREEMDNARRENRRCFNFLHRLADGTIRTVEACTGPVPVDGRTLLFSVVHDVTERKNMEEEREATIQLLRVINSTDNVHDLMKVVLLFMKQWSGCTAVGIRLKDGDDFPYFETSGFSDDFVRAENTLCATDADGHPLRDGTGNPVIECMCGNILCGRVDPSKPFFTAHGSFWSNCTTDLLASTTDADRQARTRNRCNGEGYESVALIPLRVAGETFGLLQLNDSQRGRFTPRLITLLERLGDNLAIGLAQRRVEQALRESESRFRHFMEADPNAILLFDSQLNYLYFNRAAQELTGVTLEQARGRNLADFVPNVRETGRDVKYREVIRTGQPLSIDAYAPGGIFGDKLFSVRAFKVDDNLGVIWTDITERKRAEDALRESEAGLAAAQRIARLGSWQWDIASDTARWSEETFRIFGVTRDSLEQHRMGFVDMIHPDDRQRVDQALADALRGTKAYDLDYRIQGTDGIEKVIHAQAEVVRASDGQPLVMRGTVQDITDRKRSEDALRESEARLRLAMAAGRIGLWDWDMATGKITWSRGHEELWCMAPGAFQGTYREFDERLHPDDRPGLQAAIAKAMDERTTYRCEFRVVWPDHSIHWIIGQGEPLLDSGGKVVRMVGVVMDITERKAMETFLRDSEAQYRAIVENTMDVVMLTQPDGTISYLSPSCRDMLGHNPEDLVGRRKWIICPEDTPAADVAFRDALAGKSGSNFEYRIHTRAGEVKWVSHSWRPIEEGGTVRLIVSVVRDITERKRAEDALRESEEKFSKVFNRAPVLMTISTVEDGTYLDVNNAFEEVTGFRREEALGQSSTSFGWIDRKDRDRHIAKLQELGRVTGQELSLRTKDGRCVQCLYSGEVITLGGRPHLLSIALDITDRKQAEEALHTYQRQLRSLASELALAEERERRRIAVELHDRVGQTLIFSKMKIQDLGADVKGMAVGRSLDEVCALIDRAIEDARTLTFDLSSPLLYELGFEEATAEWLHETIERRHGLATEFWDDHQPKPLADDVRVVLFQAVRELLVNVVKHARAKRVKVAVGRVCGHVRVEVQDDGRGFPPAPAPGPRREPRRGGFGLFSIRERLEYLGGGMEIQSGPDHGARVTLTAPLRL